MQIGIMGCSGYAGRQLVQILLHHNKIELIGLSSNSLEGEYARDIFPSFSRDNDVKIISNDVFINHANSFDLVFTALPHKISMISIQKLILNNSNIKIIDLSADYRFNNKNDYKTWYNTKHLDEYNLKKSVYGLCELNREKIKSSNIIGNPGCYPTSILLGILPLLKTEIVDLNSIIIDSKSGYTGAGIKPETFKLFSESIDNSYPYGIGTHRHTGEIENIINTVSDKKIIVQFTPNMIPVKRGIISNIFVNLKIKITQMELEKIYTNYYKKELFIKIHNNIPKLNQSIGNNECHIGVSIDKRTNRLVIISTIDNLIKGAAGQAVQNMNIMFNFNEDEGLKIIKTNI